MSWSVQNNPHEDPGHGKNEHKSRYSDREVHKYLKFLMNTLKPHIVLIKYLFTKISNE